MGKRISRTVPVAHTLLGSLLAGASFSAVAQGQTLPAEALDWQAWSQDEAPQQLCRGRYVMPGYRLPAEENPETLSVETEEVDYAADGEALLRGDVVLVATCAWWRDAGCVLGLTRHSQPQRPQKLGPSAA